MEPKENVLYFSFYYLFFVLSINSKGVWLGYWEVRNRTIMINVVYYPFRSWTSLHQHHSCSSHAHKTPICGHLQQSPIASLIDPFSIHHGRLPSSRSAWRGMIGKDIVDIMYIRSLCKKFVLISYLYNRLFPSLIWYSWIYIRCFASCKRKAIHKNLKIYHLKRNL